MFRYKFPLALDLIVKLVQLEIMHKREESLHDQVGLLVLDSVEGYVFADLEDVVAVVGEDLLEGG